MNTLSHRNLTVWLSSQPDDRIAALLRARPDLLAPPPADFSVLANRVSLKASVLRAMESLDAFVMQVLDALRLLEETSGASIQVLHDITAGLAPDHAVDRAAERLRSLALVWGNDESLRVVDTVREVTSPYPAGLGRPVKALLANHRNAQITPILEALGLPSARQPEATDAISNHFANPTALSVLLEECGKQERAVLDQLAMADLPIGEVKDAMRPVRVRAADTPVRWLLAHGLLVAIDSQTVELPREIGLLIRGNRPIRTLQVTQPELETETFPPSTVDTIAAAQAAATLRLIAALGEEYGEDPPDRLQTGGISMRDLRRLARLLDVSETTAALYVEVAQAAGLLAPSEGPNAEWLPTQRFDRWLNARAETRWVELARSWLAMPRLPLLIGRPDETERPMAALSNDIERQWTVSVRRRLLMLLTELPPGTAASTESVTRALSWRAPRRARQCTQEVVESMLFEAETLGLTGRGALANYTRKLLTRGDPLRPLAALLPQPVQEVVLQADLTIVAPGPLAPDLAREIALFADVESAGAGTVYRITEATMRRAFDAGRSAEDIRQFLCEVSQDPVPQTLTYLINDVARQHGDLRTGMAVSYLRCDDESLLAEVLAERGVSELGLRRLAPTVLVSSAPVSKVLDVLRLNGYAPIAETSDGTALFNRPYSRRLPGSSPTPRGSFPQSAPPQHDLGRIVRAMRAAEIARHQHDETTSSDTINQTPAEVLAFLQGATRQSEPVVLHYLGNDGTVSNHTVEPIAVRGGYLRAFEHKVNAVRTFALHRVRSATWLDAAGDP